MMQFGCQEGRDASARFDTLGYLAANPNVAAAAINPLQHFLQFGIYEGRQAVNDGVWH
jgi:serralysin